MSYMMWDRMNVVIHEEELRLWILGPVYTMDQDVVLGHCKSVDWLLNSSRDHFGFHQGENGRVTMEVEVPIS